MPFDLFSILFFLMFFLVLGIILFTFVRGIRQWNQNNHSPRLTVEATVVSKRTDFYRHLRGDVMDMPHSATSYYVTFQVESGDRMELPVPGTEYGMLVEGDRGKLTFQGSRYLSFARS